MDTIDLEFILNNQAIVRRGVGPDQKLNDFLREDLGMTGTKFGCGIAVCRACTVAVQRVPGARMEPLRTCTTPVSDVNGRIVTTVEGLAQGDGQLHPLQKAFLKHFSFQCGYSAPGFLMASLCLMDKLRRSPIPRSAVDAAIAEAVGQHICRCTGYVRYYQAIREVILETPGLVV
jgi:aerobic-type carbon monoxide dehydrogenase small subunit (CoxS/CutS family)